MGSREEQVIEVQRFCARTDPPFRGIIPLAPRGKPKDGYQKRKEAAKSEGVRWLANKDYKEEDGWEVPRGWFVCESFDMVIAVLKQEPIDSLPVWIPDGVSTSNLPELLDALKKKRDVTEKADAASRKRHEPSEADQERDIIERLGIPPDAPDEISALLQKGVHAWDADHIKGAKRYIPPGNGVSLGPRSGLSTAGRLLRGFEMELVAVDTFNAYVQKASSTGDWSMPEVKLEKQPRSKPRYNMEGHLLGTYKKRPRSDDTNMTLVERMNRPEKRMVDNSRDWHGALPDVRPLDWQLALVDEKQPGIGEAVYRPPPPLVCDRCRAPVSLQFLVCECAAGEADWGIGVNAALGVAGARVTLALTKDIRPADRWDPEAYH